jgi:hypothetical protein
MRFCALLAAGALALGAAAVRAEEDTGALPKPDQPAPVADEAMPAFTLSVPTSPQPAQPAAVPSSAPCDCCACCSSCGGHHGGHQRFWEWLTFCPVKSPCCGHSCHGGCGGCGGDSSCCCASTPCCQHLYVYFLDRCLPNFGYALPTPSVVGPIPSPVPLEGPPGGDCNPCGPVPPCHYPCGITGTPGPSLTV